MLGYDSNDRAPLKSALKALTAVQAEWDILDDAGGEVEWGVAPLLSRAVLRKGRCRYGYAPTLAEKLHNPAICASINMSIQRGFKSGYALALYENCYRFKNVGSMGWRDNQLLRRLLGIGDSYCYKSFKHLNAKTIKPVTCEINKSSDIEIMPEFKKQGRDISEIRFIIKPNQQLPLMDIDDDDSVKGTLVYKRLIAVGISHKLALQWIVTRGEDYVRDKLDYASKPRNGGRIRESVTCFINAALMNDYNTANTLTVNAKVKEKTKKLDIEVVENKAEAARRAEKQARVKRGKSPSAWLETLALARRDEVLSGLEPP